jgi:exosome complex component RRP43
MATAGTKRPAEAPPAPAPTLSYPAPIFEALAPHSFLRAHLSSASSSGQSSKKSKTQHVRPNGRSPKTFRTPYIHTGSLTHAQGSAVIRLGNTVAVCGIRAEILKAEDEVEIEGPSSEAEVQGEADEQGSGIAEEDEEISRLNLLVPNFELSTGSTPSLVPGNAPGVIQQTLTSRIHRLLLSSGIIRASDLRILYTPPSATSAPEGMEISHEEETSHIQDPSGDLDAPNPVIKGHWVLYIDTIFISLDGNAFDAAWLAILAALRDTRLPRAYFDEEIEMILCDDDVAQARRLNLRGLPIPATFSVFEAAKSADVNAGDGKGEELAGDAVLADPDAREEASCLENVCVVVDCSREKTEGDGVLTRISKSGGAVVDRRILKGLVELAKDRWRQCKEVLDSAAGTA